MPIHMRIPKRGFNKPFRARYVEVTLVRLQRAVDVGRLDGGQSIDATAMVKAGLFKRSRDGVRLLATGSLSAKLDLVVTGATASSVKAVEAAGGSVTLVHKKAAKAAAGEIEEAAADPAD